MPPSVRTSRSGALRPVALRSWVSERAPTRSRRASTIATSQGAASRSAVGSAARTWTLWLRSSRAGRISTEEPVVLVNIRMCGMVPPLVGNAHHRAMSPVRHTGVPESQQEFAQVYLQAPGGPGSIGTPDQPDAARRFPRGSGSRAVLQGGDSKCGHGGWCGRGRRRRAGRGVLCLGSLGGSARGSPLRGRRDRLGGAGSASVLPRGRGGRPPSRRRRVRRRGVRSAPPRGRGPCG